MGAAAKKRKTNVQKYHCTSCMTDRAASTFPDYNPTETCEHMIHTCKACESSPPCSAFLPLRRSADTRVGLKKWIETQLESTVFAGGVKCPECSEMMNRRDVEMAVTQKVFKR